MFKTILSIFTGFAVWTVLWLSTNAGLRAGFPDWYNKAPGSAPSSAVVLAATIICSLLAGFTTANISETWRPVIILSVLQLLVGILVTVSYWNSAPLWYHLMFLLLIIPMHLLGARLKLA